MKVTREDGDGGDQEGRAASSRSAPRPAATPGGAATAVRSPARPRWPPARRRPGCPGPGSARPRSASSRAACSSWRRPPSTTSTTCSSQLTATRARAGRNGWMRRVAAADGGEDGRGDEHRDDERRQPEPVVAEEPGEERDRWRGEDQQRGEAHDALQRAPVGQEGQRRQAVRDDLQDDVHDADRPDGPVPEAGDHVGDGEVGGQVGVEAAPPAGRDRRRVHAVGQLRGRASRGPSRRRRGASRSRRGASWRCGPGRARPPAPPVRTPSAGRSRRARPG